MHTYLKYIMSQFYIHHCTHTYIQYIYFKNAKIYSRNVKYVISPFTATLSHETSVNYCME